MKTLLTTLDFHLKRTSLTHCVSIRNSKRTRDSSVAIIMKWNLMSSWGDKTLAVSSIFSIAILNQGTLTWLCKLVRENSTFIWDQKRTHQATINGFTSLSRTNQTLVSLRLTFWTSRKNKAFTPRAWRFVSRPKRESGTETASVSATSQADWTRPRKRIKGRLSTMSWVLPTISRQGMTQSSSLTAFLIRSVTCRVHLNNCNWKRPTSHVCPTSAIVSLA
jgi:hypothetical protein